MGFTAVILHFNDLITYYQSYLFSVILMVLAFYFLFNIYLNFIRIHTNAFLKIIYTCKYSA